MLSRVQRSGIEIRSGLEGQKDPAPKGKTRGELVISLDFELLWGVRDHADRQSYGKNILGAREAIPRMLDLFARHQVAVTWATVGFLFCRNRDELMAHLPEAALRPRYTNPRLSNYSYLDEVGADEGSDPYCYGASLIDRIRQTPLQEIGTHTLSHYYCREPGQTIDAFEADLAGAIQLARTRGLSLRSIVFPRNQHGPEHLQVCRKLGLTTYRGTPRAWAYASMAGADRKPLHRAARLLDQHSGLLGAHLAHRQAGSPENMPASQFLRPVSGKLGWLHPLHLRVLKASMTEAARQGAGYHLWWHPHNFGADVEASLSALQSLLVHFDELRERYGMLSKSMDGSMVA